MSPLTCGNLMGASSAGSGGGIPANTAGSRPDTPVMGVDVITLVTAASAITGTGAWDTPSGDVIIGTGACDVPNGVTIGADIRATGTGAGVITGDTGFVPAGVIVRAAWTWDAMLAPGVIIVAKLAAREAGSG